MKRKISTFMRHQSFFLPSPAKAVLIPLMDVPEAEPSIVRWLWCMKRSGKKKVRRKQIITIITITIIILSVSLHLPNRHQDKYA
jgi:hypothetical protein